MYVYIYIYKHHKSHCGGHPGTKPMTGWHSLHFTVLLVHIHFLQVSTWVVEIILRQNRDTQILAGIRWNHSIPLIASRFLGCGWKILLELLGQSPSRSYNTVPCSAMIYPTGKGQSCRFALHTSCGKGAAKDDRQRFMYMICIYIYIGFEGLALVKGNIHNS